MDELTSNNLQVILSIKEGKGFENVSQPSIFIATLNGHSLESDIIEPYSNPKYPTDMVWEIDKNSLRKMRCGQTPLKLECFAFKDINNKEKIGYILLSIRSAQIIPKNKGINAKTNWHTLAGLKNDLKPHKPELLLSLSIEDRDSDDTTTKLDNIVVNNQTYDITTLTPSLLHEEHLIQLGPLTICQEIFLLNITTNSATNLDSLLPENSRNDMRDHLYICYRILENDVQLKPYKRDFGQNWILNEKIVVRIRSSTNILKNYLQWKPYLKIFLMYQDNIIGQSEVDLRPLILTNNTQDALKSPENTIKTLNERCFFNEKELNPDKQVERIRSHIDLQLKLQYVGVKANSNNPELDLKSANYTISSSTMNQEYRYDLEQKFTEIDLHRNPAGDFGKCAAGAPYPFKTVNDCRNTISCMHPLNYEVNNHPTVTCPYTTDHATNYPYDNMEDCSKSVEAYHYYCLHVSLITIKVSLKFSMQHIEFRFHHPKAENMSTTHSKVLVLPGEKVKLQDSGFKLHFISATDEIMQLLTTFPPKISVHDANGNNKNCISQASIDVKRLFHQNKFQCQYELPLYTNEEVKFGDLEVVLILQDHGPYHRTKRNTSDDNFGPPILDDSLAYKIVDELETWKERQKEIFKVELRKKEERHLDLLNEEWQKQRESLELKLACSIEQCKMLANSLNNATEDLRTRRLKSLEKETRLIKANEDLQWRYETKIQELNDSLRTTREELTSKIQMLEEKKAALEAELESSIKENEKLRLMVKTQAEELEVYQKGSLTQDQTASLLQELKTLEEKLNSAQKSKTFFKEQWGKAVREIHKMKKEHQQAIEMQIKNNKEELKNLDLEEILSADSTALTKDQTLLNQIQKEIDVFKPVQSFIQKDTSEQIFTPTNDLFPKSSHGSMKPLSNKSEEHDERLRSLIEERDSLLKTGSYTNDDAIIMKLNTEIRNLLINN